ncbi:MAG: esterase family protein [Clostridiaceae bacterium]|jgi:putative tributyrin esterase|nr:esterase family protein [Clostridiaceae bacterium]
MALLQINFKSETIQMEQTLNVILPQVGLYEGEKQRQIKERGFQVLYLLHGLSDDHSVWLRHTSIERYALEYGIAVVMPNASRSFYVDMRYGPDYYTYISYEIPYIVQTILPISSAREDNFIAGLSMGGYGAFMIALRNPDQYEAAASLSGTLDLTPGFSLQEEGYKKMAREIFGTKLEYIKSDYNLIRLVKKQSMSGERLPRLYQCCGTGDFVYSVNRRFRAAALKYGLDLTYEEKPGAYEWSYWDSNLRQILTWMLKREPQKSIMLRFETVGNAVP